MKRVVSAVLMAGLVSVGLLVLRPAAAAPGDVDPSFGTNGSVETAIGSDGAIDGIVFQPDGKIVAGGSSSVPVGSYFETSFTLARYGPDGDLDPSFGSSGVVRGPSGGAYAIALQPDGKIVLGGRRFIEERGHRAYITIARYEPNGALDPGFGEAGVMTGPEGSVSGLAIQPDGKIVAAGSAEFGIELLRLNIDGSLDASFGSSGIVHTLHGKEAGAADVALLPDGKILAGGSSVPGVAPPPPPPPPAPPPPPPPGPPPEPYRMMLARYDSTGNLDSSFGGGGVVDTTLGFSAGINALRLQPDGKIVTVGSSTATFYGSASLTLARYRADGSLDTAFGKNGIASTSTGDLGFGVQMALAPDGKVVAVGGDDLVRYLGDGHLDPTFGTGGKVSLGLQPLTPTTLALQGSDRIVVGGLVNGQNSRWAMTRFFASSATTISAQRTIRYGSSMLIRGNVATAVAGEEVQILKRGCYDAGTHTAAVTRSGTGGAWKARVRLDSRTVFQARVDGQTTRELPVAVSPTLSLTKIGHHRYRARAFAGRSLRGVALVLQGSTRGKWVGMRKVVLRRIARHRSGIVSSADFSVRANARQRLRLFFPQAGRFACYSQSTSRVVRG